MWPFSIRRRAREKAFIREAFSRYMPQDLLEDLLTRPRRVALEKRTIPFALLQLRDDDSAATVETLGRAIDIAVDAQGMIDIMPPFLLIAFGFPLEDTAENLLNLRQRMIENLLKNCGSDIRIVYGKADSLIGNIGSERRFTYGAAIPRLSTAMHRLITLEFGTASDVTL